MADEDVTFAEMDYADWLRQWDRINSGEMRYELRAVCREMGVDYDSLGDDDA